MHMRRTTVDAKQNAVFRMYLVKINMHAPTTLKSAKKTSKKHKQTTNKEPTSSRATNCAAKL